VDILPPITCDSDSSARRTERFCPSPPVLDQFLDLHKVKRVSNKSKSAIYAEIRDGTFPVPVPIGKGRVAWLASEIAAWQRARIAARDNRRRGRQLAGVVPQNTGASS
jgi:prophage regulatory protein